MSKARGAAGSRLRLSLCMIARDEERLLPACLVSVAGLVDEIILVDTGSTDGTREVARRAGALVIDRPWDDDFSAARNEALRHATGDWVLQLDADERLAPGAGPGLRRAMASTTIDLGMLLLHDASREDAPAGEVVSGRARLGQPIRLPRLFRRLPGLRYQGLVHETVNPEYTSVSADVDADIVHLGAIPALRAARGKSERNRRLLLRRCELDPTSVTSFALLAVDLLDEQQFEEAGRVAERGWALIDAQPPWRSIHMLAMARALVASQAGQPWKVLATVAVAERRQGPSSDLCYLQGCALEVESLRLSGGPGRERLVAAVEAYRMALIRRPGEGARQFIHGAAGWAARVRLATALLRLGEHAEAQREYQLAAAEAPEPLEARLGEVEARLDSGDADGALRAVEPLLGPRPDGWILAAAAAVAKADPDAARDLLAAAGQRLGNGLLAPHRAIRARALAGAPPPDFPALLSALLEGRPVAPADRGAAVDLELLRQVATATLAAGRRDQLERLLTPAAEAACLGLPWWVRAVLGDLGPALDPLP